jgi:hypothetical protein
LLCSRRFKKGQHPALMIQNVVFFNSRRQPVKTCPIQINTSIHQLSYKDLFNINYVVLTWHLIHHYILYKYKFVFDAIWNQHGFTSLWIRHRYMKKAQATAQSTKILILKICKVVSIEHQLRNIPIIHQCELSNLIRIVWCTIQGIIGSHNI